MRRATVRRPGFTPLAGIALAAVALTAGVAFLVVGPPGDGGGDDVQSVVRRADRLTGDRVAVTGRVDEVISARSFTLTDGSETVLVLGASAVPAVDDDLDHVVVGERVEVAGVLQKFSLEEIERQVGDLIDDRYRAFAGQPAIVADGIFPR